MSQSEDNRAVWGCISAVLVAVIGGLVTLAVNDKLPFISPPTATFVPTEIVLPPTPTPIPVPDSSSATILAPLPSNYGCPADARAGWLQFRDTWYGPWAGYYLRYDLYYFYVYDPAQWDASTGSYGLQIPYSNQVDRNTWQQLNGSPFWVCIDQPGNVYTIYVPNG
jgi:hypothetical protein